MSSNINNFITKHKFTILYVSTILALMIMRENKNSLIIAQGVLVLLLWYLPFRMRIPFKAINTFILVFFLFESADSLITDSAKHINILSLLLATALFLSILINIFAVLKDFYMRTSKGLTIKIGYGLRLGYIISSFIIVISSILLSFSRIYEDIYYLDDRAFALAGGVDFNGLYYSCITYFTVGFGDIIPAMPMSRYVSITQMIIGYFITCLIIPILLVAIQKLFQTAKKTRPHKETGISM